MQELEVRVIRVTLESSQGNKQGIIGIRFFYMEFLRFLATKGVVDFGNSFNLREEGS